jgi:hypothetical protein
MFVGRSALTARGKGGLNFIRLAEVPFSAPIRKPRNRIEQRWSIGRTDWSLCTSKAHSPALKGGCFNSAGGHPSVVPAVSQRCCARRTPDRLHNTERRRECGDKIMAASRKGATQAASPSYCSDCRPEYGNRKWPNRNRYPTVSNPVHKKRPPDSHDSEESLSGGPNQLLSMLRSASGVRYFLVPQDENATECNHVVPLEGCASIPQKM